MKILSRRLLTRENFICYRNLLMSKNHTLYRMNSSYRERDLQPKRVAVTQMTASRDKDINFKTCVDLVERAARSGAQMVFLPEACDYIAESKEESVQLAESIHGPLVAKYRELAASTHVWLSLGGLHIKNEGEDKISNTHLMIDDRGMIVSSYSKVHLFSVHIPERNLHLEEKTYVSAGGSIRPPVSTPVGQVALSICYDMRFPEMSLIQRKLGAQILTFPSAFTVTTGLAHWEALLRVRAIETQCYVVAAAQTGQHNIKRSSYGHAMIVDPWGAVVCQVSEGTNFALADINLEYLETIRQEMPVLSHRRLDLYHVNDVQLPDSSRICDLYPFPSPYISYQFGTVAVPGSCVFLKSRLSQAFVNKKPLVPGHILVTSERPAKRLVELQVPEISDLAQLTQKALEVVMCQYKPESCQIAIQDGPAAGQTIDHIHIHIVPQSSAPTQKLQGHEEDFVSQWRDTTEMEEEAGQLRGVAMQILPGLSNTVSGISDDVEVPDPRCPQSFQFGSVKVPSGCVFVKTKHSCAFVAPNPVLPGRFRKASADQLTDLFLSVQSAQHLVETSQNADSSTIVLLENSHSSQADQLQYLQLHAHIIPRTEGDLTNSDDIYDSILSHYQQCSEWTFTEQLLALAGQLRSL
ncbi:Nitrilase and fragile histidine triad fusion protein NitFhit-like [Homarus americanus]|uniref:Nitrilase and fragile histidine triad fusion protein NitFhit n=1 Tax=Homarus americanus TaxID=6706 RepID=A0A8J5MJP2_HOMAM|nr:Nitrilase and fragile histidine triad fusion protein NitFhit-like [Homarus americanus]